MSPKRSTPPSFGCLLLLITGGALLVVVAVAIVVSIPAQVRDTFGPPSPSLSQVQRMRLVFQLWQQRQALTKPISPIGSEQDFRVELGETITTVSSKLEQQGLIASADAFQAYLVYRGLDVSLQAGDYHLSSTMTAVEIAHAMQDATPSAVVFNVFAGWRMEEIAAALPTSGLSIPPEAFLELGRQFPQGYSFSTELPENSNAEGYLAPGVYEFARGTTVEEFLHTLLNASDATLAPNLRQGFSAQGLNLHEGITLASIIQREAIQEDELPSIASVFYNRLAAGMPLATDPTVQYALGYNTSQNTWWTNPLSLADLEVVSPYNTYRVPGLPPGPICNPGLPALKAVANPAQTPYYYFRAGCDGSGRHNFAVTFEEHQANACP